MLNHRDMKLSQLLDPRQMERYLRAFVELAPLALSVADREGNVLAVSKPPGVPDTVVGHPALQVLATEQPIAETVRPQARAPISIHGHSIGEVIGISLDPERVSASTIASITRLVSETLADQAYKEHELNSLATELLSRYEEITLLYDLSQALSSVFDIQTICDIALEKALQAVVAEKAFIALMDEDTEQLTVVAARGMDGFVGWKIPVSQGISGRVAASGKQILLHAGEPSPSNTQEERASLDAVLSVPLILSTGQAKGEDRVLGVMTMAGKPAGEIFTAGDAKLLSTIATQVAIAVHNSRLIEALREAERVRQEMEIAARIQRSLLPDHPPQIPGVALAGRCLPAANVGGDYYDFLTDEAGHLNLLIADVSGHSVGAALMMAMARSILRREMSLGKSPAAVLADTNTALLADLTNAGLFITVFCARYDPTTRQLTFANGGHNPPLLWHAAEKQIAELDSDGMIVGILDDVQYEERTVALAPGDVLVLYTDGVIEARSPEGEQLGEHRLRALLTEYNRLPPHALAERVCEAVNRHTQDTAQQDDITLLVLKVQEES